MSAEKNLHRDQFARDGYYVCENVLEPDLVDRLNASSDHILDQRQAWARFRVDHDGDDLGVFLAETEWITSQGAS